MRDLRREYYSRQVWNLPHGLYSEKYAVLGALACQKCGVGACACPPGVSTVPPGLESPLRGESILPGAELALPPVALFKEFPWPCGPPNLMKIGVG